LSNLGIYGAMLGPVMPNLTNGDVNGSAIDHNGLARQRTVIISRRYGNFFIAHTSLSIIIIPRAG